MIHRSQICTIVKAWRLAWSFRLWVTGRCGLFTFLVSSTWVSRLAPYARACRLMDTWWSPVPVGPPQVYLTLSLRNLGFTTTQSNLLSIPSYVIGLSMLLFTAYLSEIVNSRVAATIVLQIWALPLLVALYTFDESTSQWIYFSVVTLITGFPYVHPIQVAWASRNSYSVRTRTISASAYNMFVQAGVIIYVELPSVVSLEVYSHGSSF